MQINTIKTFLASLFLSLSFLSYASENKESSADEEAFNASELIFHHIGDSHSFHVAGDFSLSLPIILWTDNGLVTFSSGEFHHDVDGKVIVEKEEKIRRLEAGILALQKEVKRRKRKK